MRTLLTALIAVLSVTLAAPAYAERWSGTDPARDHVPPGGGGTSDGSGDVVRVKVDHAPRRVFVDTVFRDGPYDELKIYLDTRPARPGVEFAITKTYYGAFLWRIHRDGRFGPRLRCGDLTVHLDGRNTWAAKISRACLRGPAGNRPTQVRVRVHSSDDSGYFTSDWAPGRRKLSPWLASGAARGSKVIERG